MSGSSLATEQLKDVRTDAGLRAALTQVRSDGDWDSPTGRLVVHALRAASRRWQARHADVVDPHRIEHLVGAAWEMVATHVDAVIGARSPWAFIHAAMWHVSCSTVLADDLGVSERHARHLLQSRTLSTLPKLHTTVRLGTSQTMEYVPAHTGDSSSDPVADEALDHIEPDPTADWDDALKILHDELVSAGAPSVPAAEAIRAAVEAAASTDSPSRMHTQVYRSGLAGGLDRDQLRALAELVIGTRRGGPGESAWWMLRRSLADGERPALREHPKLAARVERFAAPFRTTSAHPTELALSA